MASERTPSKKPDYEIFALIKGTKIQGQLGVGWVKEDGNIHLKFNYFADLNIARDEEVLITMFDRRKEK